MFLMHDELRVLTGAVRAKQQIAWLESKRWAYEISKLGRPVVLRAYVEQRLGLESSVAKPESEPDFSHWRQ